MQTSAKLLARLGDLIATAGANYYERIQIADTLIQDKEWLLAEFKGDDYKAAEVLEEQYFHDLSGSLTIWQLMHVYRKFPNEADWRKHKYNLRKLFELTKPEPTPRREYRSVTRKLFEEVEQRAKEMEFQVKKVNKELSARDQEISSLKDKVSRLERENIKLKGQVEELEKIVRGRLQPA